MPPTPPRPSRGPAQSAAPGDTVQPAPPGDTVQPAPPGDTVQPAPLGGQRDGRDEALTADDPDDLRQQAGAGLPSVGATRIDIAQADDRRLAAERRAAAEDDPGRPTAPWLLRASAGWSWRILVVALAAVLLLRLLAELKVLTLGMTAALLLAALLYPVFRALLRIGLPRAASAAITVLGLLALLVLALAFVGTSTAAQFDELRASLGTGLTQIRDWAVNGPLGLDPAQLDRLSSSASDQLSSNRERLTTGAISGATAAAEVLTGGLLMLFATFFLLFDGPGIWGWIVRLFSPSVRDRVDGAGAIAWATITGYIRGTVLVAAFDAVFIGLALLLVGVPLVGPLALLTFLGGFIPIAGATLAGVAAVLVALVAKGVVAALIIAAAVLAVQQIEGHVLQPLVLSHSVRLHPLAIVLSIAAGATLAGIPGAVVAVPAVAVVSRVAGHLLSRRGGTESQDRSGQQSGAGSPTRARRQEPHPTPD